MLEKLSLKTILVVGAVVIALIPAAVLGFGSSVAMEDLVFGLMVNRDRYLAQTLAAQIEEFLDSRRRVISTLAAVAAQAPRFESAALTPLVAAAKHNDPAFVRVLFTDPHGITLAAEPAIGADGKPTIGLDYSDREYLQRVVRTHQPVVDNNLVFGRASKERVIVTAAPVLDEGGQLKGVVVAGVEVSSVGSLANEIRLGETGYATIATPSGQALAYGGTKGSTESVDLSIDPIWQRITTRQTGELAGYRGLAGEDRMGGFATVTSVGWKIWVTRAISEVRHEIYGAYWSIAWWVAAALAGMAVLAVLYARMIARPIEALRAAASDIADGRLERPIEARGPLEIVDLGRALKHMAQSLRRLLEAEREAKLRIEKAVGDYGALAARVASGDLTARAPAEEVEEFGRLGTSLNQMTISLAKLVKEIQGASGDLSSSASEILAATSQQVSATAEEATAVRETAATVAEVKQTADLAAQKAKAVAEAAQRAIRVAQDGQHSVDESIKGSQEGKARMEALAGRILALSEQAHAIAEINATVNDLAEQSNLLAVNASIEAAKAGDAGRGFAVVANEVKALAEQCKQATTQVRGILGEIQRATQAAVMAAEQGVKGSETGVTVASRSGEAIRLLSQNVNEAAQAAQQILAASQQQAIGMDQIALAMRNIEQSSEQTVSATRQFEGAARNLNELAQRMTALVEVVSVGRDAGA